MDLRLSGKVAVVTGASQGIGLAIAQALAAEDTKVVTGARRSSDELAGYENLHQVQVDLTTSDGPSRLIEEATRRLGGIDILVNNVGAVRPRLEGFLSMDDAEWDWALTTNFMSAVRTTRAALPHLLERTPATIINISSINSFQPDPAAIDYCAAKSALSSLSKALSKEFGPQGLRVSTVSPGPVDTALWLGEDGVAKTVAHATNGESDEVASGAIADSATGRFTHAYEVADLVTLLASERAGNVTGADFVIDGGLVQTL